MPLETVIENMQADPDITEQQVGSVIEEYDKEEEKKSGFIKEEGEKQPTVKDIINNTYSTYKEEGIDYATDHPIVIKPTPGSRNLKTITINNITKERGEYRYTKNHKNYSGTSIFTNRPGDEEKENFEKALFLHDWDKKKNDIIHSVLSDEDKKLLEKNPQYYIERAKKLAEKTIQKPDELYDFQLDEYIETHTPNINAQIEEYVVKAQQEFSVKFQKEGKEYIDAIVAKNEAIFKPKIDALQAPIIAKHRNIYDPKKEKIENKVKLEQQQILRNEIDKGEWDGYSQQQLFAIYESRVAEELQVSPEIEKLNSEYVKNVNSELKKNPEISALQTQFEDAVNTDINLSKPLEELAAANKLLLEEQTNEFVKRLQPRFTLIPKSIYNRMDERFDDLGFSALPAKQKVYALNNAWNNLEDELRNQKKEGWINDKDIAAKKQEFFHRYYHRFLKDKKGQYSTFVIKDYSESILLTVDDKIAEVERQLAPSIKPYNYAALTKDLKGLKRIKKYAEDIVNNPEKLDGTWAQNFWNGFTSGRATDYIPFVSGIVELNDSYAIKKIADKAKANKKLNKEEQLTLQLYALRNISDQRVNDLGSGFNGYNAGKLTHEMMPYIGEFILTSGAFSATRTATKQVLKKVILKKTDDVIKRYIAIAGKTAPTSLKFADKTIDAISWIAGTFAQTTVNPQHYITETFKNMTPEVVLALSEEGDELIAALEGEGMETFEAMMKGFGVTWAEFGTERMGELIPGMGRWIRKDLMKNPDWMKRLLLGRYLAKKGWTKSEAINHFRKSKMGWHGFGGEMFEEIVNQPLSNLIMGKDWNEGMDADFFTELGQSMGVTQLVFGGISLASMNRGGPVVMMIQGERYNTVDEFMEAYNSKEVQDALADPNQKINIRIDNDFVLSDKIAKELEKSENQDKQNNLETNEENLRDKIQATEIEIVAATTPEEQTKLDEVEEKLEVVNNKREAITNNPQFSEEQRSAALAEIETEVNSLEDEKQDIIGGVTERVEAKKSKEEYVKTKEGVKTLIKEADADVTIIEAETETEAAEQAYVNVEEQVFDLEQELEEEGKTQRANYDAAYEAAINEGKTEQEAQEIGAAAYDMQTLDNIKAEVDNLRENQLNTAEDMANSHGVISPDGKTIIINKAYSLSTKGGNINVEAHEFLHKALRATLNNNPQTSLALGNALKAYLMQINPSLVRDASFRKRIQAYQNGTLEGEITAAEEVLTIFSDALATKVINFNEGVFDKLGSVFKRVLRGMGVLADFESGKDVFDFIREYNKTIRGEIPASERMKRIIKGGATIGGQLKTDVKGYGDLIKKIQEKGYKFSKSESPILEAQANEEGKKVNYIYNNRKGNPNWKFDIANVYEGMLAKYLERIENKGASLGRNSQERSENIEDFISNAKFGSHGIVDLIGTFNSKEMVDVKDPATGKIVQEPNTMSRWLNGTFPQRMSEFTENTTIDFDAWKVALEDAGEIVSTEVGADVAIDIKAKKKRKEKELSFRQSIVFKGKFGIDNELIEKVVASVIKAFGTELPSVTTAEFRIALEKAFATELKTPIANAMGTRGVYDQFLIDNVDNFKFLPINTLVSIERQVDVDKKIFARFIKRLTTQEEVREAVNAGLLVVKTEEQGPALYERLNPTEEQILAFYRGKNIEDVLGYKVATSTLGTRKDRLAEEFGIELASDATMEVLETNKDVADKIEMLYNDKVENYAIEVGKRINRSSGYKFSTPEAREINEANLSPADYAFLLTDNVNELQNKYPAIYFILEEKYAKENKPPADFKNERYLGQVKNLIPELAPFINKKGHQTKFKVKDEYTFDKKGLREHFNDYTLPLLDFMPAFMGVRENQAIGNYKFLENSILKGGSSRGNAGHNLTVWNQRREQFRGKLTRDMGSKMTERAEKAWAEFEKVQQHLILANSTFTGPNSLLRRIKEIQQMNITAKEKVKIARKEFNPKALDAAQKLFTAYNISIEDWVDEQVNSGKMTREKAMEYVIRDKQKNTNFVKGERALAAFTSVYFVDWAQKVEHTKGEHVADMATVSAKTTNSIYRGTFEADAMSILNGFEQSYIPSRFAKQMDRLGGENSPLKNRRFLLNPKIGKNVYDLATGKSMYELEFDKFISEQTNLLLTAHTNSEKTSGFTDAYRFSLPIKPDKGMSAWDFDDTVAKTKSKVLWVAPDGTTGKLTAGEYARDYTSLVAKGYKFDFSEFNKVVKGQKGPFFKKFVDRIKKFGVKDNFILTARPRAAALAIQEFLKSQGLDIPIENIAALENSTPEAKALWLIGKVGEGYNNIYFADDALQNIQAVKNTMSQFDVKSKVQQARYKFSKDTDAKFNEILERTKGIPKEMRFSEAKAKQRGAKADRFTLFIPPSADDFAGLLMNFYGKGKQGMQDAAWFKEALLDPFARGYRDLNTERERVAGEYKTLIKKFPEVKKKLNKEIPTRDFTYGDAVRVYLWTKAGFEVPGLSETDKNNMVKLISNDTTLVTFADALGLISKGYTKPGEYWLTQNIVSDLETDGSLGDGRKKHLEQWIQNKDIIFSKENLNKIEAVYGSNFREALEDMLYRMENGTNRTVGDNRIVNDFLNWLNGGISVVMNWNTRSAVLQTLSTVNFINWGDNNVAKAAAAFANIPQFAKDFVFIFNSDMLKQRRKGLKTDIASSEIAAAMQGSKNKVRAIIRYLLKIGFTPTKIADSFAIAMGGSTFYRNRIKTYLEQGMTQEEAESQAWLDFQEIAEETQQSSRPDRISMQQASPLGRLILAFQNTPMQYMRLTKKEVSDLVNGRFEGLTGSNSFASKTGKIIYYAAIQNLIFYSMQTALFAMLYSDDDDDDEFIKKKQHRVANNMSDGILRGLGVGGAVISTIKNMMIKHHEQTQKKYNYDESAVLMEFLKLSPPLSIKARQIVSAEKTLRYNKDVIKEMETFDIDNPAWSAIFNIIEATTNAPTNRMHNKFMNVRESLNQQHEAWQRIAMFFGWSRWDVGVESLEIELVRERVKKKKKAAKKIETEQKKIEIQRAEEEVYRIQQEKEIEEGKKDIKCIAPTKSGRCGLPIVPGKEYCTIHEKVEQREDNKKTKCKGKRTDGESCGIMTSNKSGYCYYHD